MAAELVREPGFLSPEQCLVVRRGMDRGTAEEAEILDKGIRPEAEIRRASLVEPAADLVREIEARMESCRGRVASVLDVTIGEREGPGFIRYSAGGFYKPHRDRGHDPQWRPASYRAIALVLFLNTSRENSPEGDFEGGVLRLFTHGDTVDVVPQAGLLVAFRADVLHEVTEVRGGTRDTIVDWFYDA